MYERGKEVVREWLWQPGLSRAPRLGFQTRMCKQDIQHVMPSVSVSTTLREKKSQQTSKIFTCWGLLTPSLTPTRVVPPPIPCHQKWCAPPPLAPERVLMGLLRVWVLCVCRAAHLHRGWGCNVLTKRGLGRSIHTFVSLEGARCKGTAVQNHSLPLLCWPTTCTNGRVETNAGGGGGSALNSSRPLVSRSGTVSWVISASG